MSSDLSVFVSVDERMGGWRSGMNGGGRTERKREKMFCFFRKRIFADFGRTRCARQFFFTGNFFKMSLFGLINFQGAVLL